MTKELVDFYNLKDDGNWIGSELDAFGSATANLCNRLPEQLQFSPNGINTWDWLQTDFMGMKIDLSVDSFITYLTSQLQEYSMPIMNANYEVDFKGNLNIDIILSTKQSVGVTFNGL